MTEAIPPTSAPPRFRQLKRATTLTLLILALLAGLRIWWGHEAQRWEDALVREFHSHGEKILPADYAVEPIPDDQNAAVLLKAAANDFALTPAEEAWDNNFSNLLPLTPTDVKAIAGLRNHNSSVLADIRAARSRPRMDWGFRQGAPVRALPQEMNKVRPLANFLGYVFLYEHQAGNDADAIELLLDLHYLHHAIRQSAQTMMTSLVASGIGALEYNYIEMIAPSLDVAGASAATTRPAARAQVQRLLDRLLDESDLSDRDAMIGQRAAVAEEMRTLGQQMSPAPIEWLLAPLYQLDSLRMARRMEGQIAAATQPNYPAAAAVLPGEVDIGRASTLHAMTIILSSLSTRPLPYQITRFRSLTARRSASILLALRLYYLDHANQLPSSLDALAPQYLPRVPRDPFAAGDQPFRYIATPAGATVYSVGENGVDDGGVGGSNAWNGKDHVFRLPVTPTGSSPPVPQTSTPAAPPPR
jgi:hypothetical protein